MSDKKYVQDFAITSIEAGYPWFIFEAERIPEGYKFPFVVNEVEWAGISEEPPDFPMYPDAILIEEFIITEAKMWDAITHVANETGYSTLGLWENHDADIADLVMQHACFGETRYG